MIGPVTALKPDTPLVADLKALFNQVDMIPECNCDAGGDDELESRFVCAKHRALRQIQALIWRNGGGIYE